MIVQVFVAAIKNLFRAIYLTDAYCLKIIRNINVSDMYFMLLQVRILYYKYLITSEKYRLKYKYN